MNKIVTKEIDFNGRKLKLETGKLALQADASVVVSWGETVVLVTVVSKPPVEVTDHFPLSVDYVEKYYAGGRISSSKFIKRENRPSEGAILSGRLIDRSIRPLFPGDFQSAVQVIITVLSIDQISDPDVAGLIGASAALSISSVPWHGPLGAVRVEHPNLDLLVAASSDKVVMIEAGANQADEKMVFEAIKEGYNQAQPVIGLIEDFTKEAGREKQQYSHIAEEIEETLIDEIKKLARERIEAALFDNEHPWHEATGDMIKEELSLKYAQSLTPQIVSGIFDKVAKEIMNETILGQGKRVDGRAMDEMRPVSIEVGVLPRTHGSAIFQRGDTQVLSVVTLGAAALSQPIEGMYGEEQKRFMHFYNMSINPFSTGEVKRIGSPNRRDIGHGSLVEKALSPVIPKEEDFPYAIRVVSEVLAANASTSMASLCASTLALLNTGVPLIEPVAGIALGLLSSPINLKSNKDKFQVITDMRAVEDFYGEMDFKVAGTKNGITAIQMDTKLEGISFEIIEQALEMGQKTRLDILDKMNEVISQPAPLSPHAPRVGMLHIKPEEIGMLIGPGGKNINGIIAKTGAQIDVKDDGTVMISSTSEESIKAAISSVEGMFKTVSVGEEFMGKVVRLTAFGAFVEIAPGKDGLVHISQMAPGHVERAEDVVSEGQEVKVRVTDVSSDGKIGLSMLFGEDMKPQSEGRPRSSPRFGPPRREAGEAGDGGRPRFAGGRSTGGFRSDRPRPFGRFDRPARRSFSQGGGIRNRNRSGGGGFGR